MATIMVDFERVQQLWHRLDEGLKTPAAPSSASAIEHADYRAALAHDLAATFLRATIDHLAVWLRSSRASAERSVGTRWPRLLPAMRHGWLRNRP